MSIRNVMFLALVLIALFQVCYNQPTNFNYANHGKDWPGDCSNKALNKQSPIVLPRTNINSTKQSYLFADLKNTQAIATIYNTTILIKPKDQDDSFGELYTKLIDQSAIAFKAIQIRIRTQSEHRINDQNGTYDLEIQITANQLFDSENNKKIMIGLLFRAIDNAQKDPFLDQIIQNAPAQLNKDFKISANLNHLLSREKIFNFWFYLGSITIPTCRNGLMNWIVPDKIFQMSKTQLDYFTTKYPGGNWRQVQDDQGNQIGYATALPPSAQF